MSKIVFTKEDIIKLKKNKNTLKVSIRPFLLPLITFTTAIEFFVVFPRLSSANLI